MQAYGFSGGWHINKYDAWISLLGMWLEPFTRIEVKAAQRGTQSRSVISTRVLYCLATSR